MRYRRLGLAGLGVAAALGMSACNADDLVRVNEDPNNPTSAPPQPVFTFATRSAMQRFYGRTPMNMTGPVLTGQHLAESLGMDYDDIDKIVFGGGTNGSAARTASGLNVQALDGVQTGIAEGCIRRADRVGSLPEASIRYHGSARYDDQLAVLTRETGDWLIRSIHWSSRRR